MAITFEKHRRTRCTPKVRIGRKAHRLDTQIRKIEHILENVKRFQSGDPNYSYFKTLGDCVCYGGSEYLEARGVLWSEVEMVEDEHGEHRKYQQFRYYLTNRADVEKCLKELLDMRPTLEEDDALEVVEVA